MEGHLGSRVKLILPSECIAPRAEEDMPMGISEPKSEPKGRIYFLKNKSAPFFPQIKNFCTTLAKAYVIPETVF